MGRPLEKAVFQPLDVKLIPQVALGGDQYRVVILQKFQYLNQDGGIVAQASDFSTTANIYSHLDYASKVSSAEAMLNGLGMGSNPENDT